MDRKQIHEMCRIKANSKVDLKDYKPDWNGDKKRSKKERKNRAEEILSQDVSRLADAQELLYAADTWSVLLIFQAMDAAGKDGTIKHVMSGVNPQGCQVFSFKHPSAEELDHSFLWRYQRCLPERGRIGIFNRSYYEEVLVVRVHQALLNAQRIPDIKKPSKVWQDRFRDINGFEKHLADNGTLILKFFLNVSKEEQKNRFLERLNNPEKNWKFSAADITERGFWDDYMHAYEEMLSNTSTDWAPWYVIPADNKWVTRAIVASVVCEAIKGLKLSYPKVGNEKLKDFTKAKRLLMAE
jgi:PPK2 family polyphosphate:nucleotide phosphotransferase